MEIGKSEKTIPFVGVKQPFGGGQNSPFWGQKGPF